MQVSVEQSGAIERKLTVSVPRAEVDSEIETRLRKLAHSARVPGFRPGKAPPHIISQRYRAQVANEVISDTINSSYREALKRETIEPAGLLSIEPRPFVAGDDLQYVATIEIYPAIPSPTLAGRRIEQPVCEVGEKDVQHALLQLRTRNAEFAVKLDGSGAAAGDRLSIDFEGTIDGTPFPGGSARDHQFILGEGQMLPALDSALTGTFTGAEKQVDFTFPHDYPASEVAGKAARFAVSVKAVERRVLPALDDAFAERVGVAGGMTELRAQLDAGLRREAAARVRETTRRRVMDELLAANPITAPSMLVEAEIDRRLEELNQRLAAQGIPKRELPRDELAAVSRRHVSLGLIVSGIIEQAGLTADADAVRKRIAEMAKEYASEANANADADTDTDTAAAMIKWYHADPSRLRPVEAMLLEEQVVARMLTTAEVTEKRVSLAELLTPPADADDDSNQPQADAQPTAQS